MLDTIRSLLEPEFKTDIHDCARCNGSHDEIPVFGFTKNQPEACTHWTFCPAEEEPILVTVDFSE